MTKQSEIARKIKANSKAGAEMLNYVWANPLPTLGTTERCRADIEAVNEVTALLAKRYAKS